MKTTKLFFVSAATVILPLTLNSCIGDDGKDAIILGNNIVSDIPDDTHADPNPSLYGGTTATMPNIQYAVVTEDGDAIFRMDMTGIQDPATHEWIKLYGTDERNQNIWVEVDNTPKGIKVYNTIDEADTHSVAIDMTFLVDNSGSMDDEANAIARDIMDWAKSLSSNLDIRFACVGYDGAINGAIDFTTVENLSKWLNEGSGTYRTTGFGGANADALKKDIESYRTGGNSDKECGMAALRYADETFNFRKGSNRIYVNFTDEGNQPGGKKEFSVESLKTDWDTSRGTIHTVFTNNR
ncbi:MAG: VWA domain-containing protein, partial [Muribaculaceae bacterium]|nr:VWA domain-containing protein [Muribaculaceae bacterium]